MTQLKLDPFAPSSNIITSTINRWYRAAVHILFLPIVFYFNMDSKYVFLKAPDKEVKYIHFMIGQKNKIVRCFEFCYEQAPNTLHPMNSLLVSDPWFHTKHWALKEKQKKSWEVEPAETNFIHPKWFEFNVL